MTIEISGDACHVTAHMLITPWLIADQNLA